MRSSNSTPSSFIRAIFRRFSRETCALTTAAGESSTDSSVDSTSSAYASSRPFDLASWSSPCSFKSVGRNSTANSESGCVRSNRSDKSNPRVTARPDVSIAPVSWTIPASRRDRYMEMARLWCFLCLILGSWFFRSRSYRPRLPSPRRDSTAKIIPCVTSNELSKVSGAPVSPFLNVSSFHITNPLSGGLDFLNFFALPPFATASNAFCSFFKFSTTCGGAWHHTNPSSSNPRLPARPAICWNSRVVKRRVLFPSNLHSCVNSTDRIGTFTPTPSVSVPQMAFSKPFPASFSTKRRYLGNKPAWCTPTPCEMYRLSSFPTGVSNLNAPSSSASARFSSFVSASVEHRSCARSFAVFCVKLTMYTGARSVSSSVLTDSNRVVVRYSYVSGTGRSPPPTTATSRPAAFPLRSLTNLDVSPNVADIIRNCASGISTMGTCHAHPRSRSV